MEQRTQLAISKLRISTMTTTCQMGTVIDLEILFNNIKTIPYWFLGEGVLKMEYKGQTKGVCRNDIMLKRKREKKTFFNQSSIVIRLERAEHIWKEVNIKLFSNGGIQMTGVPDDATGHAAIEWLGQHIETTYKDVFKSARNIHKYETQLVNSDYSIGVPIKRERLHKILVETYGLFSTFESTIYQGVNTKYYYNKARKEGPPGICLCPNPCDGTGLGEKIGDCKRITISPFQTGRIIITGARSLEQIEEAYHFMNKLFMKHANEIIRTIMVNPKTEPSQITKSNSNKTKHIWVPHPSPRNIVSIDAEKITETLPELNQ
jgi:TATA-box binding protein (TBP) (component of TFIID and TFIIIB)